MKDLIAHAKRELALVELGNSDPLYKSSIASAVLPLVAVFSANDIVTAPGPLIAELFAKLIRGEALSPITDDPNEWDICEDVQAPVRALWRSRRVLSVYSRDGGKTHYDENEPLDKYRQRVIRESKPTRIYAEASYAECAQALPANRKTLRQEIESLSDGGLRGYAAVADVLAVLDKHERQGILT